MKEYLKKLVIFGLFTLPLYVVFIFCTFTGLIVGSYYGFAVDNDDLLYIGKNSKMDVYDNGEFVRTVYRTERGYRFTIQEEHLYIASGGLVEITDLSGVLIETVDDSTRSELIRLSKQKNSFVTDDAKYMATNTFGFYKITKYNNDGGNEVVYQNPIFDFVLRLAGPIGFVSFVIFFLVGLIKTVAQNPPKSFWDLLFFPRMRG